MVLEQKMGLEQLEQALYEHIRGSYKKSRYFNMNWFHSCRQSALRKLDFPNIIAEILDPKTYSIQKKVKGNRISYEFYLKDRGRYHLHRTIAIHKNTHNVLNIKKRDAINDPFVYAVAIRFKYLLLPKKWVLLGCFGETETKKFFMKKHVEKPVNILEVKDQWFNRMRFFKNDLKLFSVIFAKIRSLSNLKPFSQDEIDELAVVALRWVRKDRRRRNRKPKKGLVL